jgi:hypothetical protein
MKKKKRIPSFWWDYDPAGGPRVVVETNAIDGPIAIFNGTDGFLNSHMAEKLIDDLNSGRKSLKDYLRNQNESRG